MVQPFKQQGTRVLLRDRYKEINLRSSVDFCSSLHKYGLMFTSSIVDIN